MCDWNRNDLRDVTLSSFKNRTIKMPRKEAIERFACLCLLTHITVYENDVNFLLN